MRFYNYTPYPAHLFRGCLDAQRVLACAMLRCTYDVAGEALRPAEAQDWPISAGPWTGPHGPMPGDQRFVRAGIDVFVFGAARSPGGRPAPKIDVEVRVGPSWRSRLVAWGERRWQRRGGRLVPGEPEPVREVPLVLARAYGGKDRWDGIDVPFVGNPDGKGFYLEEARAAGAPLPDLEDPDAPVRAWDDRPDPVGTVACAEHFPPRARRGIDVDPESGQVRALRPEFWNDAFPKMIAPRARPGDRVEIVGVRAEGPLAFTLPDNDLRVRVQVGDDVGERTPEIDQIGIEVDARRVFLTYRFPFTYWLRPHERRSCMFGLVEPD